MGRNGVRDAAAEGKGSGYTVSALFPFRSELQTMSLAYFRVERGCKRCFRRISEADVAVIFRFLPLPKRNCAGNAVSSLPTERMGLETLFPASLFSGRRQRCAIRHMIVSEIRYLQPD